MPKINCLIVDDDDDILDILSERFNSVCPEFKIKICNNTRG